MWRNLFSFPYRRTVSRKATNATTLFSTACKEDSNRDHFWKTSFFSSCSDFCGKEQAPNSQEDTPRARNSLLGTEITGRYYQDGINTYQFSLPHLGRVLIASSRGAIGSEVDDRVDLKTLVGLVNFYPIVKGRDSLFSNFDSYKASMCFFSVFTTSKTSSATLNLVLLENLEHLLLVLDVGQLEFVARRGADLESVKIILLFAHLISQLR